jgi:hypothetical protein
VVDRGNTDRGIEVLLYTAREGARELDRSCSSGATTGNIWSVAMGFTTQEEEGEVEVMSVVSEGDGGAVSVVEAHEDELMLVVSEGEGGARQEEC